MISPQLHDAVLNRDKICLWCMYRKYMKGEDIAVRKSAQCHHVIKKKYIKKRLQSQLDVIYNLVGVCEECHIGRLVDNYAATCYFVWYLRERCKYPFDVWYDNLDMEIKENF